MNIAKIFFKYGVSESLLNEIINQKHCTHVFLDLSFIFLDDESFQIINEPYHCCIIHNFIRDEEFLQQLKSDVLSLEFHEKSNDLYKFQQVCERQFLFLLNF